MTWLEHHSKCEQLAADAELAVSQGDSVRAHHLYMKAAQAEERALNEIDSSKPRTLGITAVSAVSLYYKAGQLEDAEGLAYRSLATAHLPEFASEDLRELLQSIWSEKVRKRAGVGFAPGQLVVSVKGGEIVEGGAPLDLIVEKVQTVQSLFYRTVEYLQRLPHRKRGLPNKEIQDSCQPWLFQTAPGSYQFAVAVQEPREPDMLRKDEPRPTDIAEQLLNILRVSIEAPENKLPVLVPDADYRSTFLKLTRNLAPTGRRFKQLDVRLASETKPLSLFPKSRHVITEAIRATRPTTLAEPGPEREKTLRGTLRALHLDDDWIELTVDGTSIHVTQVGQAVDDVIGPLVNRPVVVQVVEDARGKNVFRDIEADD
ncbi:conserved hypothetical protein [uncultured Defluviicoccus sp.]|uniref:Uncharacterized protein n=1 Tax=metagenome TaxID=256318 RepID=A0A380TAG9_9ZZZZ|nr:conserved hypothetical protein [uncultured Defluviicoccus sp.]